MTDKKRTERKPLLKCRKHRDDVKTAGASLLRDQAPTKPVFGRSGIRHERWPELVREAVTRTDYLGSQMSLRFVALAPERPAPIRLPLFDVPTKKKEGFVWGESKGVE